VKRKAKTDRDDYTSLPQMRVNFRWLALLFDFVRLRFPLPVIQIARSTV